jgi:hypothetical protein
MIDISVYNMRRVPTGNPLHARVDCSPELRAEAGRSNGDYCLNFSTKFRRRLDRDVPMLCHLVHQASKPIQLLSDVQTILSVQISNITYIQQAGWLNPYAALSQVHFN